MTRQDWPTFVFAVDDAYCTPLLVAWESLRASNPDLAPGLDVVVIHEDLAKDSVTRLQSHAERLDLSLRLCRAPMPELPYNVAFGGTRANYLRLAIPDLLGDEGRAIYLDADIVVLDSLRPLLGADLGGLPLGAVRDQVNPCYGIGQATPGWQRLGIPGDREYFNSGVLVIDLAAASREKLFARCFQVVADHQDLLRLWDQDALNIAADDHWARLDRRWNCAPLSALTRTPWVRYRAEHLVPLAELVAAEDDAAIIHYLSPAKPWKGLLPEGTARDLYQRFAQAVAASEPERLSEQPDAAASTNDDRERDESAGD